MVHQAKRILVVANETIGGDVLIETIARVAPASEAEVLALAPALTSRLAYWTSSDDRARRDAEHRLARCIELLAAAGVHAEGVVGDADPLRAIEDALHLFPADQMVIATHPEERSNWLARNVVAKSREAFGLPVLHIVVDLERHAEYLMAA
jgi:hypothetical protein